MWKGEESKIIRNQPWKGRNKVLEIGLVNFWLPVLIFYSWACAYF